jgi:hypothetical protein
MLHAVNTHDRDGPAAPPRRMCVPQPLVATPMIPVPVAPTWLSVLWLRQSGSASATLVPSSTTWGAKAHEGRPSPLRLDKAHHKPGPYLPVASARPY